MLRFSREVVDEFGGCCDFVDAVDVCLVRWSRSRKRGKSVGGPSHPVLLQLELHRRACTCVYWVPRLPFCKLLESMMLEFVTYVLACVKYVCMFFFQQFSHPLTTPAMRKSILDFVEVVDK